MEVEQTGQVNNSDNELSVNPRGLKYSERFYKALGSSQIVLGIGSLFLGCWAIPNAADELKTTVWSPFWIGCLGLLTGYVFILSLRSSDKKLTVAAASISLMTCVSSLGIGCFGFTYLMILSSNDGRIFYIIQISISLLNLMISGVLTSSAWRIRDIERKRSQNMTQFTALETPLRAPPYVYQNRLVYFQNRDYTDAPPPYDEPPPYEE